MAAASFPRWVVPLLAAWSLAVLPRVDAQACGTITCSTGVLDPDTNECIVETDAMATAIRSCPASPVVGQTFQLVGDKCWIYNFCGPSGGVPYMANNGPCCYTDVTGPVPAFMTCPNGNTPYCDSTGSCYCYGIQSCTGGCGSTAEYPPYPPLSCNVLPITTGTSYSCPIGATGPTPQNKCITRVPAQVGPSCSPTPASTPPPTPSSSGTAASTPDSTPPPTPASTPPPTPPQTPDGTPPPTPPQTPASTPPPTPPQTPASTPPPTASSTSTGQPVAPSASSTSSSSGQAAPVTPTSTATITMPVAASSSPTAFPTVSPTSPMSISILTSVSPPAPSLSSSSSATQLPPSQSPSSPSLGPVISGLPTSSSSSPVVVSSPTASASGGNAASLTASPTQSSGAGGAAGGGADDDGTGTIIGVTDDDGSGTNGGSSAGGGGGASPGPNSNAGGGNPAGPAGGNSMDADDRKKIIVAVLGSLAGLLLCGLCVFGAFYLYRRRSKRELSKAMKKSHLGSPAQEGIALSPLAILAGTNPAAAMKFASSSHKQPGLNAGDSTTGASKATMSKLLASNGLVTASSGNRPASAMLEACATTNATTNPLAAGPAAALTSLPPSMLRMAATSFKSNNIAIKKGRVGNAPRLVPGVDAPAGLDTVPVPTSGHRPSVAERLGSSLSRMMARFSEGRNGGTDADAAAEDSAYAGDECSDGDLGTGISYADGGGDDDDEGVGDGDAGHGFIYEESKNGSPRELTPPSSLTLTALSPLAGRDARASRVSLAARSSFAFQPLGSASPDGDTLPTRAARGYGRSSADDADSSSAIGGGNAAAAAAGRFGRSSAVFAGNDLLRPTRLPRGPTRLNSARAIAQSASDYIASGSNQHY